MPKPSHADAGGAAGAAVPAAPPAPALPPAPTPPDASLEALARPYAVVALEALAGIVQGNDSAAARVSAANAILDRAYGKARQALEHSGREGGPVALAAPDGSTVDPREAAMTIAFALALAARQADGG